MKIKFDFAGRRELLSWRFPKSHRQRLDALELNLNIQSDKVFVVSTNSLCDAKHCLSPFPRFLLITIETNK